MAESASSPPPSDHTAPSARPPRLRDLGLDGVGQQGHQGHQGHQSDHGHHGEGPRVDDHPRPTPPPVELDAIERPAVDLELDRRSGSVALAERPTLQQALASAIAEARRQDRHVVVFRARWSLVGLHRWSEPCLPPVEEVGAVVEERIRTVDPSFVVERNGHELLGFAAQPRPVLDAELLAGLLASELTRPVGPQMSEAAVTPRLGVVLVGGPGEVDRPGEAAIRAIDAAGRTLDQTMGSTPYLVHNDYIQNRSHRQDEVLRALPQALLEEQITLEFQPRVDVSTGKQVGLEVFPRWTHPELGTVPTLEFLLVAEREGLLAEIGRRTRSSALAMARRWAEERTLIHRRLWFDLAPIELADPGFCDEAAELLAQSGGVGIGFEISDSPLLEHEALTRVLDQLSELGVGVALDNVRPSTLSLGRIQRLPLTGLNLDREVIRLLPTDPVSCQLVSLVCAYAAKRGQTVTACQVESADELRLVEELGVDLVQGYAVSKPLAEAELWPLLDRAGR